MKIISKCKDYYDHEIAHFGYDETRVYDRLNVHDTSSLWSKHSIAFCGKIVRIVKKNGKLYFERSDELNNYDNQFLYDSGYSTKIKEKFRSPVIDIASINFEQTTFKIPILSKLGFPKLYDSRTAYSMIYDFMGWLKDNPEQPDNQTDKEKVISHGFDAKRSFRPKMKTV